MTRRIIDLTTPIISDHIRWKTERRLLSSHARGDVSQVTWIGMPVHAFTHIDAGRHFAEDGFTTSGFELEKLIGDAAIIDLMPVSPNEAIDAQRLVGAGADIHGHEIVLLKTGWDAQVSIEELQYWTSAPYLTSNAARWLYSHSPTVVGFDFPQDKCIRDYATGARKPSLEENTTHVELLMKGIPMIEYLVNLANVSRKRVQFSGLPLNIPDCDGAPIRAIAVEE